MSGRGRTFLLVGLILLVIAIAVVGIAVIGGLGGGGRIEPTPTPPQTVGIVVAVQKLERGQQILSNTVGIYEWPRNLVPRDALYSVDEVMGLYAASDIPAGLPVLSSMVAETLAAVGFGPSDLPLKIPPGKVGLALPISRLSSVGYALKPGDHVDALASFLLLDLDEEFQTKLMNNQLLAVMGGQGVSFMQVQPGGRDRNSVLGFPAIEQPSEQQRPRLVAQLTVQDMIVLGMGDWLSQSQPPQPTPEPQGKGPQPTPQPAAVPDIVTLIADPQDALVLKFLREAGATIDLVLRSSQDSNQTFVTESVTLQYIFTRFEVAEPPRLPYGIEKPLPEGMVPQQTE